MHELIDIKKYEDDDNDDNILMQGGYSADKIINMLDGEAKDTVNTIKLDDRLTGGSLIFPDSLRELLKELYVPIGLFTRIEPCSTRSFSHDGTCVAEGIFNELNILTSVLYKSGGTRKNSTDTPKKKTFRKYLNKN